MTMIVGGVGLVAFRDANGIRPLVVGKKDDESFMIAQKALLLVLWVMNLIDIDPGAAVIISESGVVEKSICAESISHSPCLLSLYTFRARLCYRLYISS